MRKASGRHPGPVTVKLWTVEHPDKYVIVGPSVATKATIDIAVFWGHAWPMLTVESLKEIELVRHFNYPQAVSLTAADRHLQDRVEPMLRASNRRPLLRHGYFSSGVLGINFGTFHNHWDKLSREELNKTSNANWVKLKELTSRRKAFLDANPHPLRTRDEHGRTLLYGQCHAEEVVYTDQLHVMNLNVASLIKQVDHKPHLNYTSVLPVFRDGCEQHTSCPCNFNLFNAISNRVSNQENPSHPRVI